MVVCLAIGFAGCAAKKGNIVPPDMPLDVDADPKAGSVDRRPAHMRIQYGNKSSKVNMIVDVNNQDVYLKMSGEPESPAEEKFPWLGKKPQEPPPGGEGDSLPEERDWEELVDMTQASALDGKNVAKVIAEIRKAQEFFYQKRYAEALDMVKLSLQKQETADGYALMGSVLYMMGDSDGARDSWMQTLRLNPDMPAVGNMLQRLNEER